MANPQKNDNDELSVFLKEAKRLYSDYHRCEFKLFTHLIHGEQSGAIPWQGAYDSFAQLLKENALPDASRYESFKASLERVEKTDAETIGVDGCIYAGRVDDIETRAEAVKALTLWTKSHEHPPSQETAKNIVDAISPVKRLPKDLKAQLKLEQLVLENAALRRELRVAKIALAKANARIVELEQVAPATKKKRGQDQAEA